MSMMWDSALNRVQQLPYIYVPEEIAQLIGAANRLRESYPLRRQVYATMLGLIAATLHRGGLCHLLSARDSLTDNRRRVQRIESWWYSSDYTQLFEGEITCLPWCRLADDDVIYKTNAQDYCGFVDLPSQPHVGLGRSWARSGRWLKTPASAQKLGARVGTLSQKDWSANVERRNNREGEGTQMRR